LGQVLAANDVKIDRSRVEREMRKNLEEYVRLLSLRTALAKRDPEKRGSRYLVEELIADKLEQSMERAFRLLKIAYKEEDIHRVHNAARSRDKRARASAGEFLDTLLGRGDQAPLRQLFRIVVDEASDSDRVGRAVSSGVVPAYSSSKALATETRPSRPWRRTTR
jgi:hypothetical protein